MMRVTYIAITRRGVWGAKSPRRWNGSTNFRPPTEKHFQRHWLNVILPPYKVPVAFHVGYRIRYFVRLHNCKSVKKKYSGIEKNVGYCRCKAVGRHRSKYSFFEVNLIVEYSNVEGLILIKDFMVALLACAGIAVMRLINNRQLLLFMKKKDVILIYLNLYIVRTSCYKNCCSFMFPPYVLFVLYSLCC